ncbi:MAG TPA: hypothetical protein VEI50_10075 [Nitrospiraceae bacterium]|jgi:hypothetical protein|nr:hypothetical protein [Nitrospiraceae bacterium]
MASIGITMLAAAAEAHQAGGVEVGDLETGSVVGQPFKELDVDLEIYATEVGSLKVLYPPTTVLDLKVRPGAPVVIKVTNKSTVDRGFLMTADGTQAAPTVLKAQVVLKPGESKYIGVPLSDLMYATVGNTLTYRDHLNPKDPGGKLIMIK